MLKVNSLIMETCKFVAILLLYCVTTAYCYPSKPLNERSTPELTWQAWLLVDQNQNKQQTNADGMLRRRITPKSVFIAPTFSPESLPDCADGYTSDVMDRCVPIIKIDEDAHFSFLIEKLKQKFAPADFDYQSEEETSTQGPLQFNIPLVDIEEGGEETDAAIIISPTKAFSVSLDKRDSEDEKKQEIFLKKLVETTTNEPDLSTFTEPITTLSTEGITTVTADVTSATDPVVTTEEDATTSTESHNTKRNTDSVEADITTTTEELPETTTTDSTTIQPRPVTISASKLLVTRSETYTPTIFKFPEDLHSQNLKNSFVKFPDTDVSFQTQIPSSVNSSPSVRDVSSHAVVPVLMDAAVSDSKVVFPGQSQPEEANLDYSNGVRHLPTTTYRSFNRRNRDKPSSMFLLPPRWSQPNFQKPLVLRFSRKHAYLDEAQLKHPDYYRAVPMDDYAYLFSKDRHSSHR